MRPYYQDASVTLYHGDATTALAGIADNSVDLLLTDPPYGISYATSRRSRHDPLSAGIANDGDLSALEASLADLQRVLAPSRHWYVFASPRVIVDAMPMLSVLGSGVKSVLCWDKGDAGTVGDLECGFGEAWEAVLFGDTGRRPWFAPRPRTVFRQDWSGTRDPVHPCVKPVDLLQKFITLSTAPGETVLDPFSGSGTTLFAAKSLARKAIGFELEERFCEIAATRLSQEVLAL